MRIESVVEMEGSKEEDCFHGGVHPKWEFSQGH
jgi:hypothetical protein